MQRLVTFALVALPLFVSAEVYREIGPLDTLGDVKARMPGAQVKKVSAAWLQPTDALYDFTGPGISGTLIVKFDDGRPESKKAFDLATDELSKAAFQKLIDLSDDDALTVSWVRWAPRVPFSIQRLISKYGPPEKQAFSDDDFQPYREWQKRGVTAYLTDDEKNVMSIDFNFTKSERRQAFATKFGWVPPDLREDPVPKASTKTPPMSPKPTPKPRS